MMSDDTITRSTIDLTGAAPPIPALSIRGLAVSRDGGGGVEERL